MSHSAFKDQYKAKHAIDKMSIKPKSIWIVLNAMPEIYEESTALFCCFLQEQLKELPWDRDVHQI